MNYDAANLVKVSHYSFVLGCDKVKVYTAMPREINKNLQKYQKKRELKSCILKDLLVGTEGTYLNIVKAIYDNPQPL